MKLSIRMTPPRHVRMLDAAANFGMSAKLIPTTAVPADNKMMTYSSTAERAQKDKQIEAFIGAIREYEVGGNRCPECGRRLHGTYKK